MDTTIVFIQEDSLLPAFDLESFDPELTPDGLTVQETLDQRRRSSGLGKKRPNIIPERRIAMSRHWVLFLVSLLLLVPGKGVSAEAKNIPATGKYVMGDRDSKSDAKKIALLNAKQMALETAGTYLTSLSRVQDYELTHNEISSLSAGIIAVKVIDEVWSMEGESPVVTITIQATIDTAGLEDRIRIVRGDKETVEAYKHIQDQLATLKAELAQLRAAEREPESESKQPTREEPTHREKQDIIKQLLSIEQVRNASSYLSRGKSDAALADLTHAISLDPSSFYAFLKRSQAYESRKAYKKALGDVDSALRINPINEYAHALKGRILTKSGQLHQALKSFTRGIAANPMSGVCYYGRAVAKMQMKRVRNAYSDFDRACKLGIKDGCKKVRNLKMIREKATKQEKGMSNRKRMRKQRLSD